MCRATVGWKSMSSVRLPIAATWTSQKNGKWIPTPLPQTSLLSCVGVTAPVASRAVTARPWTVSWTIALTSRIVVRRRLRTCPRCARPTTTRRQTNGPSTSMTRLQETSIGSSQMDGGKSRQWMGPWHPIKRTGCGRWAKLLRPGQKIAALLLSKSRRRPLEHGMTVLASMKEKSVQWKLCRFSAEGENQRLVQPVLRP